jgi:hypothetical protein
MLGDFEVRTPQYWGAGGRKSRFTQEVYYFEVLYYKKRSAQILVFFAHPPKRYHL